MWQQLSIYVFKFCTEAYSPIYHCSTGEFKRIAPLFTPKMNKQVWKLVSARLLWWKESSSKWNHYSLSSWVCAMRMQEKKVLPKRRHRAPQVSQSSDRFYGSQFVHCCCKNRQLSGAAKWKQKPFSSCLHILLSTPLSFWAKNISAVAWTTE